MFSIRRLNKFITHKKYIPKINKLHVSLTSLTLNNNFRTFSSNNNFDNKVQPFISKPEDKEDILEKSIISNNLDYKVYPSISKPEDQEDIVEKPITSNNLDYKKFIQDTEKYTEDFHENRKIETSQQLTTYIFQISKQYGKILQLKKEKIMNKIYIFLFCIYSISYLYSIYESLSKSDRDALLKLYKSWSDWYDTSQKVEK